MSTLYREFTLTGPTVWQAIVALIKGNAAAFVESGKPLRIIVTSSDKKRNNEQNAFYWKAVLEQIADQAWVGGRKFSKEVWHEHYARKFGVCYDLEMPDGSVEVKRKSTSDMKVGEFSEYLQKVQADAAGELGVRFEVQP